MNTLPESTGSTPPPPATKGRNWTRRLGRCAFLYLVVPYLAVMMIFALFQRTMLYPATTFAPGSRSIPADIEPIQITTHDGLQLNGFWFAADHGHGPAEDESHRSRGLILHFPGNAGNRFDRISGCRELADVGFDVVLFDYRGYGDNAGSPSEAALHADARRIWKYVVEGQLVPAERIILFGESIGGAVAVRLAADLSDAGTPPGGLAVSCTFASLAETAGWHYPYFPVRILLLDRYASDEHIARVTCPIAVMHVTEDDIVPLEHGKRLFDLASEESHDGVRKQFFEVPGAIHNSVPGAVLKEALDRLLQGDDDSRVE